LSHGIGPHNCLVGLECEGVTREVVN
jgi:hypothetical protein